MDSRKDLQVCKKGTDLVKVSSNVKWAIRGLTKERIEDAKHDTEETSVADEVRYICNDALYEIPRRLVDAKHCRPEGTHTHVGLELHVGRPILACRQPRVNEEVTAYQAA